MKLAIVKDDSTIETIIEELEDYDLSKPVSRAIVVDSVRDAMERILHPENRSKYTRSFGVSRAKAYLAHLDAVRKFVEENSAGPVQEED